MEEKTEKITYEHSKRGEPWRTPAEAFAHVPVTDTVEIVPEAVKQNPDLYDRIGEERVFEIALVPAPLENPALVRPKYRDVFARRPLMTNQDDLTSLNPAGWQPS